MCLIRRLFQKGETVATLGDSPARSLVRPQRLGKVISPVYRRRPDSRLHEFDECL